MPKAHHAYDPAAQRDFVEEARRRIDSTRKEDVEVVVTGAGGRPLAGVPVDVVQLTNDFRFGDQVGQLGCMRRDGREDTYAAECFRRRFTEALSAANCLCYWTERMGSSLPKAEEFQGEGELDDFDYCVNWALSEGLVAKGHQLFWCIEKAVPDWLKRYDYETQMRFLEVRVRDLAARFRGKVSVWDATNEAVWEPAFRNLPRRHWPHLDAPGEIAEYVAQVMRWAREEDPDACLVMNDYGLTRDHAEGPPVSRDGTPVTAAMQRARTKELVRRLRDLGGAPDALGLQSHVGGWFDHSAQWAVYDELHETGLPIHITEFNASARYPEEQGLAPAAAEEMQAEYVANFVTCAYAHPAVEAFYFWGFMHFAIDWGDRGGSWHRTRPVFERVRDLVKREWMTRERATTDPAGRARFRGFPGEYSLRYPAAGGGRAAARFRVPKGTGGPFAVKALHA